MKPGARLLLIDSMINVFLGIVLMAYSEPVIDLFGLPETGQYFYPNILGAVLFGIGIALFLEYRRNEYFKGLGLGGAICINLAGGIVLFFWLAFGHLNIPDRGLIILWILDLLVLGISAFELRTILVSRKYKKPDNTNLS